MDFGISSNIEGVQDSSILWALDVEKQAESFKSQDRITCHISLAKRVFGSYSVTSSSADTVCKSLQAQAKAFKSKPPLKITDVFKCSGSASVKDKGIRFKVIDENVAINRLGSIIDLPKGKIYPVGQYSHPNDRVFTAKEAEFLFKRGYVEAA